MFLVGYLCSLWRSPVKYIVKVTTEPVVQLAAGSPEERAVAVSVPYYDDDDVNNGAPALAEAMRNDNISRLLLQFSLRRKRNSLGDQQKVGAADGCQLGYTPTFENTQGTERPKVCLKGGVDVDEGSCVTANRIKLVKHFFHPHYARKLRALNSACLHRIIEMLDRTVSYVGLAP